MFLKVEGENVSVNQETLIAKHTYNYSKIVSENPLVCQPCKVNYTFKTDLKTPKLGILLVGLGGNNGSTVTGGVLANKHGIQWMTKRGL